MSSTIRAGNTSDNRWVPQGEALKVMDQGRRLVAERLQQRPMPSPKRLDLNRHDLVTPDRRPMSASVPSFPDRRAS